MFGNALLLLLLLLLFAGGTASGPLQPRRFVWGSIASGPHRGCQEHRHGRRSTAVLGWNRPPTRLEPAGQKGKAPHEALENVRKIMVLSASIYVPSGVPSNVCLPPEGASPLGVPSLWPRSGLPGLARMACVSHVPLVSPPWIGRFGRIVHHPKPKVRSLHRSSGSQNRSRRRRAMDSSLLSAVRCHLGSNNNNDKETLEIRWSFRNA